VSTDPRRSLPSVERVLDLLDGRSGRGPSRVPRALVLDAVRQAVDAARARVEGGAAVTHAEVAADASTRVATAESRLLRPLVNATGVLVHTNLGRVPISAAALEAATAIGGGYSNLEYRTDEGRRGSRHDHAGALVARACGAEAGLVVNNNAAAVLVTLAALARDRDVIVSRGELVEIGGGFRVPEVMAESGAHLVEVGTTNRTRRADYERATTSNTAMLLKVHTSNYRMIGFVESAGIAELTTIGPPVVVDAGSGLLDESTPWLPGGRPAWLGDEPGIRQSIEAGAALVTFSGDKLLGGPQAGLIVGQRDLVETVARHPLARAVRADKLTLAAMQETMFAYLDGDATRIPLWRMACQGLDGLQLRAERIAAACRGRAAVVETEAVAGGGSLPGLTIPSIGVAIDRGSGSAADRALRSLRELGIVARIEGTAVVCDLRTVAPVDDDGLIGGLVAVLDQASGSTG
jgi:L-seryl-tRNA(Ser) seleniumtransferase